MSRGIVGTGCALITLAGLLVTHLVLAEDDPFGGTATSRDAPFLNERSFSEPDPDAVERIDAVLDRPLKAPFQYEEQPLTEIIEELQEEYDIPIVIDEAALDQLAISPETEVTVNLRNISLRSALDLMLKQPGLEDLSYGIVSEVLLISTVESLIKRLSTRVYRVDDLAASDASNFNLSRDPYDKILKVVVSCVAQDSWQANGTGEGVIRSFSPGMLVISQTHRVHEQIEELLDELRETKRQIEANASQTEATNPRPITRGFAIEVELGERPAAAQERLAAAIVRSVQWNAAGEAALSSEDVWVHVLPKRVLVRQVPMVLQQVQAVLADMQLLGSNRDEERVEKIELESSRGRF